MFYSRLLSSLPNVWPKMNSPENYSASALDKSETPNNLNGKTNGPSGKSNGVTTPQSSNGFRQMKCLETSNNDEQTSIIKRWDLFFNF